ncbi:MAG: peptidase domain protein [Candidatus Saccharibacteria bacterium]|nr:peptidase domain protein [Candidatus Saccharibacteria bacterium]
MRLNLHILPTQKTVYRTLVVLCLAVFTFTQQAAAYTTGDFFCVSNTSCFYQPCATGFTLQNDKKDSQSTISSGSVYILGDSITLRSKSQYESAFNEKGVKALVNGSSSRSLTSKGIDGDDTSSGLTAITKDKSKIEAASAVVIALGTNGDSTATNIDKAVAAVRKIQEDVPVFWVDTISVGRNDNYNKTVIGPANRAIHSQSREKQYEVIPWFNAVDGHGDALNPTETEADPSSYINNSDGLGVHPTGEGSSALANLVASAVDPPVAETNAGASTNSNLDPTVCCPTDENSAPAASLSGNGNEEKAFNYFLGKGLSKEQAAGILGNMARESGVDPQKIQGGARSKDPADAGANGYGLIQWTAGTRVVGYAKKYGVSGPIYELSTQLEIVWNHMNKDSPTGQNNILEGYKKITDAADAAVYFEIKMEGAGVKAHNERVAAARAMLTKYGGNSVAASTTEISADSNGGGACCPPKTALDGTTSIPDGSPSDWKKMYTGANKAKVATMAKGDLSNPKILVIHYTVGSQGGQELLDFFVGAKEHTGIQFNVDKDGQVYQYYPLNDMKKTYHVGNANGKAIGIEITGRDVNDLTKNSKQFESVVSLSKLLCDKYNIPCSSPKGDITGDGIDKAQGMLGHDEIPGNDHSDPDATVEQASNGGVPRDDSSKHPYMMKLRTAMGFEATPGKTGGTAAAPSDSEASASPGASGGVANACAVVDTVGGEGTTKDPVGEGPNKSLALEAVKYDTKDNNNKYTYVMGGLHGPLSQLQKFASEGGTADCSGFVRYVIWKIYGKDVGSFVTQSLPKMSDFKEVGASEVAAGDIGWREGHVDYITKNMGGGKLHQFGAHSEDTDLYGGDTSATSYTKFFRYIGPKSANQGE